MSNFEGTVTLSFLEAISGQQLPRRVDGSIDMAQITRDNAIAISANNPDLKITPVDDIYGDEGLTGAYDHIGTPEAEALYRRAGGGLVGLTVQVAHGVNHPKRPSVRSGTGVEVLWQSQEAAMRYWRNIEELAQTLES